MKSIELSTTTLVCFRRTTWRFQEHVEMWHVYIGRLWFLGRLQRFPDGRCWFNQPQGERLEFATWGDFCASLGMNDDAQQKIATELLAQEEGVEA